MKQSSGSSRCVHLIALAIGAMGVVGGATVALAAGAGQGGPAEDMRSLRRDQVAEKFRLQTEKSKVADTLQAQNRSDCKCGPVHLRIQIEGGPDLSGPLGLPITDMSAAKSLTGAQKTTAAQCSRARPYFDTMHLKCMSREEIVKAD